jgi:integrase
MLETSGLTDLQYVAQPDIARFDAFLRGLHSNFGKSPHKDRQRSIAEIVALAAIEVPKHGTLQGATRNRHLAFLNQLLDYARGAFGLPIDPALSTTPFRARKHKRGRDQRSIPPQSSIEAFFRRPLFIGYARWDDIDTPGDAFYHRAEYFCSMIAVYEGARREEYCGLHVDDIVRDNGPIPYFHIAPNGFRRIKNVQSVRNLALHPELIRLGFLDYVDAIRALGYTRLFPDLHSPSTKSPLGDRLYDQLLPSLEAAGFRPHQVRHFFGDVLKQSKVAKEFRADLLGHGGQGETDERYCNPLDIALQMESLQKLPVVTGHLEARPIRLLPWVVAREIAPWSRAAARGRRGPRAD